MRKTKTGQLLGRRIRALRKAKGLTQEQLGEASRVNYKFLGSLERGLENPSVVTLAKVAKGLEVELMELFRYHHEEANPDKLKRMITDLIKNEKVERLQIIFKVIKATK